MPIKQGLIWPKAIRKRMGNTSQKPTGNKRIISAKDRPVDLPTKGRKPCPNRLYRRPYYPIVKDRDN